MRLPTLRSARAAVRAGCGSVVVGAQQRFRARRRAGRRRLLRPLILLAATAVTVVALGWAALNSSLFAVRTVTVDGTSRLSVAQVLAAADVPRGASLFRLDPGLVQRRVAQIPAVAQVQVQRHWPHALVIRITERSAAAVVESGDQVVLLDATGVAFARQSSAPAGLVPVQVGAPVPGPGDVDARAAMQVLAALPAGVRSRVLTVHAPSPVDVSLDLRGGRTVVWGSAADSTTKAVVLRTLLHRSARVYDVSTPSVVVTR